MTLLQGLIVKVGLTFLLGALVLALFLYMTAGRNKKIGGALYAGFIATLLLLALLQFITSGLVGAVPKVVQDSIAFVAYLGLCFVLLKAMDVLLVEAYLIGRKGLYIPQVLRVLIMATGLTVSVLILLRAVLGVNVLALIALPTVATAVVGFALRDTIARFVSGIMLGRLIHVGDWVTIMGKEGVVTNISLGHVTIRTRADDYVLLPNNLITQNELQNHSRPTHPQASTVVTEASYAHPPLWVRKILADAARAVPGVVAYPEPVSVVSAFKESGIEYQLKFWLDDFSRRDRIEGEVRSYVWYAFKRHGIEIPYPQRVVQMTQPPDAAAMHEHELAAICEQLRPIDFLSILNDEELTTLAQDIRRHLYLPGEIVVHQGDRGQNLFVVVDGEASVRVEAAGQSATVATLKPGQFFGEMSLLTGEPRSATVCAETELTVLMVGKDAMSRLLTKNPGLVEQFSTILVARKTALASSLEATTRMLTKAAVQKEETSLTASIRKFFGL